MYKILDTPVLAKHGNQIWTFDNHGAPLVKQAFRNDVVASEADLSCLTPDMRQFIERDFRPDPMFCYLVINALSDEETFGANVNGDAMPRYSRYRDPLLINDTRTHGYKTYELMGHWFHHHRNRDPKHAAGFVLFSSYDLSQGIVRIFVGIDRAKDPETCADIDRGIMPLTSMGLKVPFDICTRCSKDYGTRERVEDWIHQWYTDKNLQCDFPSPGDFVLMHNSRHRDQFRKNIPGLSRWTTEYCEHLKYNMGVIDNTGFQIYAINHLPKLFDISKVFVNADKISQGIFKVAGARKPYAKASPVAWDDLSGNRGIFVDMGVREQSDMQKNASVATAPLIDFIKSSEDVKVGAIDKEAPTDGKPKVLSPERIQEIRRETAPVMEQMDSEDYKTPLPEEFHRACAARPLKRVIATLCHMRTPPTPHEFQRIFLDGSGMEHHRRMLEDRRLSFPDISFPPEYLKGMTSRIKPFLDEAFSHSPPDDDLARILEPFLGERSLFPHAYFPRMKRTIIMIKSAALPPPLPPSPINFEDFKASRDLNEEVEPRNPFSLLETLAIAAAAYPFLRKAVGKVIGQPQTLKSIPPGYLAALAGGGVAAKALGDYAFDAPSPEETVKLSHVLQKTGKITEYLPWSKSVGKAYMGSLAAVPVIHAYSLHQRRRAQRGERLGDIDRWIAMNPDALSLAYFAGAPIAGRAMRSKLPSLAKMGQALPSANEVRQKRYVADHLPQEKETAGDKILGGVTWGLMSPGRFLPSAMAGIADSAILRKILGE